MESADPLHTTLAPDLSTLTLRDCVQAARFLNRWSVCSFLPGGFLETECRAADPWEAHGCPPLPLPSRSDLSPFSPQLPLQLSTYYLLPER